MNNLKPSRMHKHQVSFSALCLGAALVLSACGERDIILAGPRSDIRGEEAALQAQVLKEPVALKTARAETLVTWQGRGTDKSNTMPHLSLASEAPRQAWAVSIGQKSTRKALLTTPPVAYNGTLFARDAGAQITAVSAQGAVVWQRDLTPSYEKAGEVSGGGLATYRGKLFVTTGFGMLHALDANTGETLWTHRFDAPAGTPNFDGDRLYVVTRNNGAFALDVTTGRELWAFETAPSQGVFAGSVSPAISGRHVVFPFSSGELVATLKRSGIRMWGTSIASSRIGVAYGTMTDITSDPLILGNRLFAATTAGRMIAVDVRSGTRLWTLAEGSTSLMAAQGDSLFAVSDRNQLLRISQRDGAVIWRQDLPFFVKNRPDRRQSIDAMHGPVFAQGRVWVAGSDGYLRAFDPETGAQSYQVEIPSGAATRPIVVEGTLYVVGQNGQLMAYR